MTTWRAPQSADLAMEFAAVMGADLRADVARTALRRFVRDDALYDAITRTIRRNAGADIRPLVAASIDEWIDWLPEREFTKPWDEEAKQILSDLVSRFTDADVRPIVGRGVLDAGMERAVRKAGFLFGAGAAVEAVRGAAPLTYVVRHIGHRQIVRVELFGGRLHRAPDREIDTLLARYFPTLH